MDALAHTPRRGAAVRGGLLQNLEPYLARQRDFREGTSSARLARRAVRGPALGPALGRGAYALVFNSDLFLARASPFPIRRSA